MVKPKDGDGGKMLSLAKLYEKMGPNAGVRGEVGHDRGVPDESHRLMYHRSRRDNPHLRLIKNAAQYVPPEDVDKQGSEPHSVLDELDGYNYFMISEEEAVRQESEAEWRRQQLRKQRQKPYHPPMKGIDTHVNKRNGWLEKPPNVEFHQELKQERQGAGSIRNTGSALKKDQSNEIDVSDNGLKFLYIDEHGNKVYGAGPQKAKAFQPLQINVKRGQGGNAPPEQQNSYNGKSSELRKNSKDIIRQYVEQNLKKRRSEKDEKPAYRTLNLYVTTNGRFGNHLFQYASLYGLARATNRVPVLPTGTEIPEMFIKSRFSIQEGSAPHDIVTVHETNSGIYSPSLYNLPPQDVLVCCYLQSWKYFNNYKTMIKHLFRFKREIRDRASEYLQNAKMTYFKKNPDFYKGQYTPALTYIGVHVRRGDYMLKEHLQRGYKPAPLSYIFRAMQYYRNKYSNCVFVVSSDDLSWCTQHINTSDVTFVSGPDQGVDLATLSACNHTIMTVGTYGWWAGWLAGGEVVYYKDWIIPGSEIESSYSPQDYFLPEWKGIGDLR